jgi:prepilin-type N-terminal cleavage/methylation domain-containing protein
MVAAAHKGSNGRRSVRQQGARGFSLLELLMVVIVTLIVAGMAVTRLLPNLQNQRSDVAMAQVEEQLRQAREYAIENRRYVQVTFPTAVVASQTQSQITMTQKNSLTANAGADVVLSTVPIETPVQFYIYTGVVDTPDAFGNSAAIYFENTSGGPSGGMYFQNDGELVDGSTFQAINGTVFLGVSTLSTTSARAITVLGSTGRVRAWKYNGSAWSQQ